jgi:hypothetical protein
MTDAGDGEGMCCKNKHKNTQDLEKFISFFA